MMKMNWKSMKSMLHSFVWDKGARAWSKWWTTPPHGEHPARRYRRVTVVVGIIAAIVLVLAIVSGAVLRLRYLPVALGVAALILFLVAKKLERSDIKRHGADDRENWLNYMGPGGAG
jgi:hypothetical protein